MGLSGRKVKQRIPADPRNLAWADDAAKFGTNYLSKFGWDSSKGLGAEGEGRISHIKVSQKLDMLGIGAAHQNDVNGIAWKQNKDFESLLKRLNEASAKDGSTSSNQEKDSNRFACGEMGKGKKEQKRVRNTDQEVSKEKANKKRKKDECGERTLIGVNKELTKSVAENAETREPPSKPQPYIPRHRAHRARAIASKTMASKSPASIAEILGIPPTQPSSTTTSGSETPAGKLTTLDDDITTLEKLTTSTKSVTDYFKEKLLAKSSRAAMIRSEIKPNSDSYTGSRSGLGSPSWKAETTSKSFAIETRGARTPSSTLVSSPSSSPSSELTPKHFPGIGSQAIKVKTEEDKQKNTEAQEQVAKSVRESHTRYAQLKKERKRIKAEKKARKKGKDRPTEEYQS